MGEGHAGANAPADGVGVVKYGGEVSVGGQIEDVLDNLASRYGVVGRRPRGLAAEDERLILRCGSETLPRLGGLVDLLSQGVKAEA